MDKRSCRFISNIMVLNKVVNKLDLVNSKYKTVFEYD